MLNKKELLLSIFISIFSVIFLWGFWTKGIYSLGFNASVLGLLFFTYFLLGIKNLKEFLKINYYWIIPIVFLILSFSIYENPYLKSINFFLLPISIIFFFNYSTTNFEGKKIWNLKMIYKTLLKKFYIIKAINTLNESINKGHISQIIIKKVLIGIIIFLFLNSIIIALLIGVDSNFGEIISNLFMYISINKIIFSLLILIILTAFKLSWKEKCIINNDEKEKEIDSIISGIVLGGTLVTYLIFIGVQIGSIFANTLPVNFLDVVNLVKNGFWQLFFVSIINIIFFFVYYKKTHNFVQKLLIIFIIASIIILISAGNKMFMYVSNYGFSYEKFTASYTVLYFGILFIMMISILFLKAKADILKIGVVLALWMYGFLNIFPMEVIIFKTNLLIANKTNSKMDKFQSHILSLDIYKSVEELKGTDIYKTQDWDSWKYERLTESIDKKWYEKNIHNFYYNED